jgi:hypothetical protein
MRSESLIHPSQILTPQRLDILPRYRYAHSIINKLPPNWGLNVYREFLEKSCLDSGYSEDGKNSFFDYLNSYNMLLHSVLSDGFDPEISSVQVQENQLVNGAHRTAISLAIGKSLPAIEVSGKKIPDNNFHKMKSLGLSESILDDILLSYAELKNSFRYLILIGCEAKTHSQFKDQVGRNPFFVGSKDLSLTEIGIRRLLTLMYGSNEWWKPEMLEQFVSLRFDDSRATSTATICFVDLPNDDEITELKTSLRKTLLSSYKYERNIHSSDTHSEALLMAQSTLNSNSRFFLNNSPLGSEIRILKELLKISIPAESIFDFCVTGSSTLEMFGIRKAGDIDLVQGPSPIDNPNYLKTMKNSYQHSELVPNYGEKVYDPRHFMYVSGYKFVSLQSCLMFKLVRNQQKDVRDVKLIQSFLLNDSRRLYAESNVANRLLQGLTLFLRQHGWERSIKAYIYRIIARVKKR